MAGKDWNQSGYVSTTIHRIPTTKTKPQIKKWPGKTGDALEYKERENKEHTHTLYPKREECYQYALTFNNFILFSTYFQQ